MGKRGKLKEAKLEGSSSEEDKRKRKSPIEAASDDDAEANEDLSFKIVQKSMQRTAKKDPRDDGFLEIVTNLKEEISKKEKKKRKKSKEVEETNEINAGFKDFCSELFLADGVEEKEQPVNDIAAEVASKAAEDNATEVASEAVETNPAEVLDNAVLRKLLRGPRYFDPPDNSWGACYNCGEEGHTTANCTSARRKRPCFVCGSFEHNAKQCSKGRDCFICKQQGHRAKDCPERSKISSKLCLKCGDLGHEMFSCRNDYCPDDLKEMQCYICGTYGHLCCQDYADPGPREVSCYRCGLSGHTGLACSGSRWDTRDTNDKSHWNTNDRSRWNSNDTPSAGSCYKCGIVGHFSRECTSSVKACSGSRWDTRDTNDKSHWNTNDRSRWNSNDIPSAGSCYKCGIVGHFSRECTSSVKTSKRHREPSTPKHKSPKKKRDLLETRSAPHDIGKTRKKKKPKSIEFSSPSKAKKHRGGWITEDPEDHYSSFSKDSHWRSPATPRERKSQSHFSHGDYAPSYHSPRKPRTNNYQDSQTRFHERTYSASRFGNDSNGGMGRNYDWG